MQKVIDIRGLNGKGLLCKARVDAQKGKSEVVIKKKDIFTKITFRDGDFSVNYYPEDPFLSGSPQ